MLPGSEGWALALLRPGEHPMRALEDATADAAPHGRLVLAVDQFEELFTACRDESEREAFVDALVASRATRAAARSCSSPCARTSTAAAPPTRSSARLLGANHVLVGPMHRDELRRAIELPARRAGLRVEPDLIDALIADVEGEPGALPLLSTSLLELWQQRDGRRLRLAAYEQAGGVHGAVARLAEGAYERLDAGQQRDGARDPAAAGGRGRGRGAVVRRGSRSTNSAGAPGRVLAELTDSRLLTVSEGEVEVAHEALLREWPRLRGWLEEDAEGRRLHRHLRGAAKRVGGGRPRPGRAVPRRAPGLGARLGDRATSPSSTRRARLPRRQPSRERARAAPPADGARRRGLPPRARRDRRAVALDQRGNARDEAVAAEAQRLGAQALARGRPRPLAAARPPGRGAGRLAADARQPARARCSRARRRSACCAATATG